MRAVEPTAGEAVPLDELDRQLLNALQSAFPLVARPFDAVGAALGLPGAEVLARVARLKSTRLVRQISAIFDSGRLGYHSSLVAMRFDPRDIDAGAAVISAHPGVSHNYQRNHAFNLWFTLAVPPERTIAAEVAALADRARPEQTWLLPTIRLFKIGVNLDLTGEAPVTAVDDRPAPSSAPAAPPVTLTTAELAAVRALQRDLPLTAEPFADLAVSAGLSPERLLALALAMRERGVLRRFAAVLHHRRAGFQANGMGVWAVPPADIDTVAPRMAAYQAVSHCYQRPTGPGWPYSVFTMIHGRQAGDCEAVVEAIAAATGVLEHALLYSTKEYKKTRVRYFLDDDAFDVASIPAR